jgi:hypothetical protein
MRQYDITVETILGEAREFSDSIDPSRGFKNLANNLEEEMRPNPELDNARFVGLPEQVSETPIDIVSVFMYSGPREPHIYSMEFLRQT